MLLYTITTNQLKLPVYERTGITRFLLDPGFEQHLCSFHYLLDHAQGDMEHYSSNRKKTPLPFIQSKTYTYTHECLGTQWADSVRWPQHHIRVFRVTFADSSVTAAAHRRLAVADAAGTGVHTT